LLWQPPRSILICEDARRLPRSALAADAQVVRQRRIDLIARGGPHLSEAPQREWLLWCNAEEFGAYVQDPRFAKLVTLARIVNNLRYNVAAVVPLGSDDSPGAVRQRMASFLSIAGTLYEALAFAKRLGKEFRGVQAFDTGLATLLRDPLVRSLHAGALKSLRHGIVHHHDETAVQVALELLVDGEEYVFASGTTFRKVDVYYELADIAAFQYAVNYPGDARPFMERLRELFDRLANITVRFGNAADALIAAQLKASGWHIRGGAPPGYDAA
jgi:hypothetical protein